MDLIQVSIGSFFSSVLQMVVFPVSSSDTMHDLRAALCIQVNPPSI